MARRRRPHGSAEKPGRVKTTLCLEADLHALLRFEASRLRVTASGLVESWIREKLAGLVFSDRRKSSDPAEGKDRPDSRGRIRIDEASAA
jgi:hypothetical protein